MALEATASRLWRDYRGIAPILDLPLVLQTLTEAALSTDLWSDNSNLDGPNIHAAAVHAYRTVASLNALSGAEGSDWFNDLAKVEPIQFGTCWSTALVRSMGETLGELSSVNSVADNCYLFEVLGACGRELAESVELLRRLAGLDEFAIDYDFRSMLDRITDQQLALLDPDRAHLLTAADFTKLGHLPRLDHTSDPSLFDIDRRIELRLAPAMVEPS